jgi:putative endopeptidase
LAGLALQLQQILNSLHWRGKIMQTKMKAFGRGRAVIALLAASTAWLAVPAQAQEAASTAAATPHAKLGAWGFDLGGRDLSVKPGDDFEKYASGTWLKNTPIGADKPEASAFYDLYDANQSQLKDLIANAPASSKAGALYNSMMDEARIEALGLTPLKADLAISERRTRALPPRG